MNYDEPGFRTSINDSRLEQRGYGLVPQGADASLRVRFFYKAELMPYRSKAEGREVYEDVLVCEMVSPGAKQIAVEVVTEEHKMRFPREWVAFQTGNATPVVGLPLDKWGALSPAQVKTFEFLGISTVEQLAALDDVQVQKVMGGVSQRAKAIEWLAGKAAAAPFSKLEAENERLRADIEMLKKQFKDEFDRELEVRNASAGTRGRGRPRKEEISPEEIPVFENV